MQKVKLEIKFMLISSTFSSQIVQTTFSFTIDAEKQTDSKKAFFSLVNCNYFLLPQHFIPLK